MFWKSCARHTLDALVEKHDAYRLVQEMLREAEQLNRRSDRYTRSRPAPGQRHEQRQEARELRKHARLLERQAVNEVIAESAGDLCHGEFRLQHS